MSDELRKTLMRLAIYGSQTVAAVVIAYAFVVVLMTAATQQRVVSLLEFRNAADRAGEQVDYSSAWTRVRTSKSREQSLARLRNEEETAVKLVALRQDERNTANLARDAAWERFAPIVTRARRIRDCEVPADAAQVQIWNAVVACAKDGVLSESLRRQVSDERTGPNFGVAHTEQQQAIRLLSQAESDLSRVKTSITNLEAKQASTALLRDAFSEMDVLQDSWMLGGGVLAPMPPTLVQIILAFVSGAFGALLITLVLLVYPDNRFNASKSQEYAARIFLGAIISLTTYIFLGAGTGVLGDSSTLGQTDANFMAFAAVGILAGMFSDRVASWLSTRADSFFGDKSPVVQPPVG